MNHPLGRAITVLNDELHSSYRIRDRQIIVVNREMKSFKFSITVLENRTNKEGKFLPASYVVHYWDAKSGDLQKTESHSQTWTRIGSFDLPGTAYVITATKDLSTRSLTLSNHQLVRSAAQMLVEQMELYAQLVDLYESIINKAQFMKGKQKITEIEGKLANLRKEWDSLPAETRLAALKASEKEWQMVQRLYLKAKERVAKIK